MKGAASPWRAGRALDAAAATWPALAAGVLFTSVVQGLRPGVWRRPVRQEFARALDDTTLGSLRAVLLAAAIVGAGIVAQAVFWLDTLGENDAVRSMLRNVLIREVAPLTVGLIMLGRLGLVQLAEFRDLRRGGALRLLAAEGVDPCLLLAMPRVLATGIATFCQSIVFVVVAVAVGYAAVSALGQEVGSLTSFAFDIMRDLGALGVVILPVKGILLGLVVGAVVMATALGPSSDDPHVIVATGFFRGLLALVLASAAISLTL